MSAIRKLASQTAIYGLSSIIGRLAVWALTPIYTARMDPSEYGVFVDLYSFVTYFLVILTFGMETSFFRFSSDDKTDPKPYTQSILFVGILATVFLVLFGFGHQGFASFLGYPERSGIVLMVVLIIFLDVMVALPMAKLRYDDRPMVFATISLFSIFINMALNIWFILILKENTAEYVFLSNVIASGIKFSLLVFFSLPVARRLEQFGDFGKKLAGVQVLPTSLKIDKPLMRSMVGFGFYIMLAGLFGMINQYSDVNFIKRIWGSEATLYHGQYMTGDDMVGIFGANKKLAVFILLVTQAFRYAAEPFFFRQAKEKNSRETFAKVFHYFMLAGLAMYMLVSSFAYEFVSIRILGFSIISENYWTGLDVVPLLLLSFVLWGAYINISIWFKLTKQVRFGILFGGVGVVVLVVLNFILIPFFGYMGAAVSMLACYAVMTYLVYTTGQKYYRITYRMLRTGLYAGIMTAAVLINGALGRSEVFSGLFFQKLLVVLAAAGAVYLLEKYRPIIWYQPVSGADTAQAEAPEPPQA